MENNYEWIPDYWTCKSPWIMVELSEWGINFDNFPVESYKKGSQIYPQYKNGEFVFILKQGRVRLDIINFSGEIKIIFIADKGSLFGELIQFDGFPNEYIATTITDVELFLINRDRFKHEIENNQRFLQTLLLILTKKTRLLVSQVKQLAMSNAYFKVAYALIHLSQQYGNFENRICKLDLKFTQQEMAELLGLSRVSVANALLDMERSGIIKKQDGHLYINNIDKLKSYVYENG